MMIPTFVLFFFTCSLHVKKLELFLQEKIPSNYCIVKHWVISCKLFFHLTAHNNHPFMSVPLVLGATDFSDLSVNVVYSGFLCVDFFKVFIYYWHSLLFFSIIFDIYIFFLGSMLSYMNVFIIFKQKPVLIFYQFEFS